MATLASVLVGLIVVLAGRSGVRATPVPFHNGTPLVIDLKTTFDTDRWRAPGACLSRGVMA